MATGRITSIRADKGFGFIATADGTEYFFHRSACTSTPFDSMHEGDTVTFTIGQGPKGPRGRGDNDLFFHRTAVVGTEFDDLREGQEVSYKTEADPRDPSRFRATDVRVVTADNA